MNLNAQEATVISRLETIDVHSRERTVVYEEGAHFEAPNWSLDGQYFIINYKGKLYKLPMDHPVLELIHTDFADRCNNDHGISPDGDKLVLSHYDSVLKKSLIYTLPVNGGKPVLITPRGPSYWHGWSPDGKTLAYCAERDGNYDIYVIPAKGGDEVRLTDAAGLDDGPDYSPDGKYIYFNSVRSGRMKIWRMAPDGSNQKQISFDYYNDWFPHPSPDGEWLVFLSYIDEVDSGSHPPFKRVMLRMINITSGKTTVLTELFGGQGTINVPSWSPDSRKIAFVSYKLVQ
jgi:Tol biopolymer transport system component|tara:strand:- start:176 stop:1039 length:864 start_codon:yes stop_codon:yes gene_type:complete